MITLFIDQMGKEIPSIPGYTDYVVRKQIGISKDTSKKGFYTESLLYEEAIKLETWDLPNVKN